jgi:hypothetical protein
MPAPSGMAVPAELANTADARHTAATVLPIHGIPTPTAMALMGWSSAVMAKRYQHLVDMIRQDVAQQVGQLLWDSDKAPPEAGQGSDASGGLRSEDE